MPSSLRIANRRKNEIVDLEARVIFSRMENDNGRLVRRFYPLTLERDKVSFLTLAWTIVHPIDHSRRQVPVGERYFDIVLSKLYTR